MLTEIYPTVASLMVFEGKEHFGGPIRAKSDFQYPVNFWPKRSVSLNNFPTRYPRTSVEDIQYSKRFTLQCPT